MTPAKRQAIAFVQADKSAIEQLLADLPADDVMSRPALESRLAEITAEISSLSADHDQSHAAAVITFGGRPVADSRGIAADFAGSAITSFQDTVAKVLAYRAGSLGQRGVVPRRFASALHVTDIVRGSFGFVLEELSDQTSGIDSSLKAAVDETASLFDALCSSSEDDLQSISEVIDDRVMKAAAAFFELAQQREATIRLVTNEIEHVFDDAAVARAALRADTTELVEAEEEIIGHLQGVLPEAHQFEFSPIGAEVVKGRVDPALSSLELTRYNREMVGVQSVGLFKVRRLKRHGAVTRISHILLKLTTID